MYISLKHVDLNQTEKTLITGRSPRN